jgi:hypothetical protein
LLFYFGYLKLFSHRIKEGDKMDDKLRNPSSYAEELLSSQNDEDKTQQKPPEVNILEGDDWLPS